VEPKDNAVWVKHCTEIEEDGTRHMGHLMETISFGLSRKDTQVCGKWRKTIKWSSG